tara:strand:+ start:1253 stop:2878 length:1626 start_codon:yes stop_codon:yes gene_type:complete
MDNPIDKVINRKKVVDDAQKEIKRRKNISKKTKGKSRKRKKKNKYKKRKKKKVTTTQVAQPPIKLDNKKGDKLEVNIVAKERRRKRKPKTFAERRADEIAKTGVADPAILKQQQRVASEVLGYNTQTRDPITLRGRRGRYNVDGGVAGFGNVSGLYDTRDPQQGIRTGLQSDAVRRKGFISMEQAEKLVQQDRKRRIPNLRRGTRGTQTEDTDTDDDDDDDPRGGGAIRKTQTKRTPAPQPEPEPTTAPAPAPRPAPPSQTTIGTTYIPPPLPRRTPPENYFAGALAPDTPLRFRPLSQPVPPATPLADVEEEIVELTGGQPASPIITGIQPVGTPQQPQYQDAPSTPTGIAFDDDGFFTPTATGLILPPEEPITTAQPPSRIVAPSVRPAEAGELERPGSALGRAPQDAPKGGGGSAFRRPPPPASPPQPAPEPEQPIQSARRGRGRPRGSKNKPRTATPFVSEETGQGIDRAELKFEMLRLQNLLKQRLGSWKAKEVDEVQSLEELNEAIQSITDDAETAELIRLFWQIRLQLGLLKKL